MTYTNTLLSDTGRTLLPMEFFACCKKRPYCYTAEATELISIPIFQIIPKSEKKDHFSVLSQAMRDTAAIFGHIIELVTALMLT